MSGETTKSAADIFGVHNMLRFSVSWYKITVTRGIFGGGVFIGLPHLSRFGIIKRTASTCLFR